MYNFHPTPQHIVQSIVKKHIPRKALLFLEPAVGNGDLISKLKFKGKEFFCIDIDNERLNIVKTLFKNYEIKFIHEDFLNTKLQSNLFDCIICNPPFNGRKSIMYNNKKMPIEAYFLIKSIELCKPNGRLIFILPSTITSGTKLSWFREQILQNCNLVYSYKLPRYTFDNVEGDFSVLVFDKYFSLKKKTTLVSHNGIKAKLNIREVSKVTFDADELIAMQNYDNLINSKYFHSCKFSDLFNTKRGSIHRDYKQAGVLHTTNYCTFKGNDNSVIDMSLDIKSLKKGDWMIKRVSRNLIESITAYDGYPVLFTDCIIRIKAVEVSDVDKSFFSLNVTLQLQTVKKLIIKGTGAKYLDVTALTNLNILKNLHSIFTHEYEEFLFSNTVDRIKISKKVAFIIENTNFSKINRISKINENILLSN